MFCPKCGTKNPEDGKFCRSCGIDIAVVNSALIGRKNSGILQSMQDDLGLDGSCDPQDKIRRNDPSEVYGDGIKSTISGVGFFIVSMALLYTGVAGGRAWWWAMLFPSFFALAKGIADILQSRRMERSQLRFASASEPLPSLNAPRDEISAPETVFLAPESRYKTGDLVPGSVTENTTRHLQNSEGETMALPRK